MEDYTLFSHDQCQGIGGPLGGLNFGASNAHAGSQSFGFGK